MQPTSFRLSRLSFAIFTLSVFCLETNGQDHPPSYSDLSIGSNTYLGLHSGTDSDGLENTFIGYCSGQMTKGSYNVYIGSLSGLNINQGSGNIFIGPKSGSQEDVSDRFYLQNNVGVPLLYGEFDSGRIGVATEKIPDGYALAVKGGIICESEVNIQMYENWPDYVFDEGYELMPIEELEDYISTHHKLPEIPSAEHIEKNGLPLGSMEVKMMKKIEEIHLYLIDLRKENEELKNRLIHTQAKLDSIINQANDEKSTR